MVPGPIPDAAARLAEVARTSHGRLLALLASADGDLAAAEDALADAYEAALSNWDGAGPERPEAWLLTVARNRQRDRWKSAAHRRSVSFDPIRHDSGRQDSRPADPGHPTPQPLAPDAIEDRRLELLAVCAHPAIDPAVRPALMLNTVLGFTAEQISRALAVPRATMASRLVRAKRRIKQLKIPFQVPGRDALPPRLTAIGEAVYGTFAIEWGSAGRQPREGLTGEAIFLAELLTELVPDDAESHGLAALIEFSAARFPARGVGSYTPLADQDPALWDSALIERARGHLRTGHRQGELGRFQLEAAIQAVHCARRDSIGTDGAGRTDWPALQRLHQGLQLLAPSLGADVALAAVLAHTEGPRSALVALDALGDRAAGFQPAWATRASLLAGLGETARARSAYDKAISLTTVSAEREHLVRRRAAL